MYRWLRLKVWFGYAGLKKRFYGTEQDNSQQSNDGLRRLRFARESRNELRVHSLSAAVENDLRIDFRRGLRKTWFR